MRPLTGADLENMEAGLDGRLRGIGYLCHPQDMRRLIAEVRRLRGDVAAVEADLAMHRRAVDRLQGQLLSVIRERNETLGGDVDVDSAALKDAIARLLPPVPDAVRATP